MKVEVEFGAGAGPVVASGVLMTDEDGGEERANLGVCVCVCDEICDEWRLDLR